MKFVVSTLQRHADAASTTHRVGEFAQFDDAVAAAKQVIDSALSRAYVPGMTSSQLLAHYEKFAQAPYIFRDDEGTINASSFNHFRYAKSRSDELCGVTA
jgi:hypothetical protein